MPQQAIARNITEKNPFKFWTESLGQVQNLDGLETVFHQTHHPSANLTEGLAEDPAIVDLTTIDELAKRISKRLLDTIETQNLIVDRAKLEELKMDNQLMAKHIYTLLQKRGIQEKQLTHLQHEQGKLKRLFWRFYYREN